MIRVFVLVVLAWRGTAQEVRSWLGIPYAAPPVGALRWRPPQPVGKAEPLGRIGPACIQPAAPGARATQSEDCLTLNVWAPREAHGAAVMVWIHGGAFISGSGGMAVYNGAALARQGVVVVTINYRLGALGFFAHPELGQDANFGLMDQIAALEWVKAHIAEYGGDPKQVTVFGESAGAMSVYLLMISPRAGGLFARAIAESGPIFGPMGTVEKAAERAAGTLKELRARPAESFASGALRTSQPLIDGKYVTEDVRAAFAAGDQAQIPFLLGVNSYEASLMPELRIPGNPKTFMERGFLEPVQFLAGRMKNAYLYYFTYVAESRRGQVPGVAHGGEIPYVFDHAADRKMAETVSAYWVNFAKTGNPNGPGLVEWPGYRKGERWLELGEEVRVRTGEMKGGG